MFISVAEGVLLMQINNRSSENEGLELALLELGLGLVLWSVVAVVYRLLSAESYTHFMMLVCKAVYSQSTFIV